MTEGRGNNPDERRSGVEHSVSAEHHQLRGSISYMDGSRAAGLLVQVFGRDLRPEEPLGEAKTDSDGHYEITYPPSQFRRREEERRADLVVRVVNEDRDELGASEVALDAADVQAIDLIVTRREALGSPNDGPEAQEEETRMTDTETEAAVQTLDEATVRGLFARFNDREAFFADPERTWVERPRYRVYAQDLEMNTRDQVVAWFHDFFDAMPDLHMEVEDVAIAGEPGRERVTVRWHITGTFSGAPYLGIEPTGRPVDLRGMDLIDVEDGRVAANNIYYDQLVFARQIGMLPHEGSLADRLMTGAFNLVTKGRAKIAERIRG